MPVVSVIIPVYNKGKYLKTLLNDLARQSWKEFECILIDDGSTDESGSLCDEMCRVDRRFKVIHIPNSGVSNARNVGLKNASGVWVTFVDSDDRLSPVYLEHLVFCITNYKVDMAISGVEKCWDNGCKNEQIRPPYQGILKIEEILPEFTQTQRETGIYGICVAKIFKKELAKEIFFDTEIRLAEDFDFYLKLYERVNTIYFDRCTHYFYQQQTEYSYTRCADEEIDYFTQLKIQLRYRDFLMRKNALKEENLKNIEMLLSNYVYFTLFYSDKSKLHKTFEEINELVRQQNIRLTGKGLLKQLVFYCLQKNSYARLWILLTGYRVGRFLKRCVKK